jgi:hypothetical protein
MLPIAVFLWFVGWSLYWAGLRKKQVHPKPTRTPDASELTFRVLVPEKEIET